MRNAMGSRSGSTAKLLSSTGVVVGILVILLLTLVCSVGGVTETTLATASSSVSSSLPPCPQADALDQNNRTTSLANDVSGNKEESVDASDDNAELDPDSCTDTLRSAGADELPLEGPAELASAESVLQGLSLSDTVSEILEDSRESLSLLSSETVLDFETKASLIVESYRSDLSLIVQETLQRRRRRRREGESDVNASPFFYWRALGSSLHEAQYNQVVLSELSRTATDFSNEVERRQREQRRRVKRRAILLAPLIFVERQRDYELLSSSSSSYASSSSPAVTVVSGASVVPPHSRQSPREEDLRQPPALHKRRKRSHRGFETFSQTDPEA